MRRAQECRGWRDQPGLKTKQQLLAPSRSRAAAGPSPAMGRKVARPLAAAVPARDQLHPSRMPRAPVQRCSAGSELPQPRQHRLCVPDASNRGTERRGCPWECAGGARRGSLGIALCRGARLPGPGCPQGGGAPRSPRVPRGNCIPCSGSLGCSGHCVVLTPAGS